MKKGGEGGIPLLAACKERANPHSHSHSPSPSAHVHTSNT